MTVETDHFSSRPVAGASGFDTVLVANRGEIACRVIRTLREMGIRSVAVYSDADRDAKHVHAADVAVHIGPAAASESYLVIDKILAAAKSTGAQAIHPGYGFLSENAEFSAACESAGVEFIGPAASSIREMGDKISAKAAVSSRDVPTVPGISRPGLTDPELIAGAEEVGFPVLIKPSAGGGGKGMHLVHEGSELPAALQTARREAASSFGDDTLFIERFVDTPRHIEVQILADAHGNVIHLGERECSLQRRHQKVIEEAPSPLLDAATRERIGAAACDAARSVGYRGAGTVEFIVSAHAPDEFFFMEMNTRLQVEHPVTEMVTGVDLVECQVRIAAGEELPLSQEEVSLRGHAIEARVYAEDPARGFLPTGGTVLALDEPSGDGIRVDSGLRPGTVVGGNYDPMLSKIIAWAPTRDAALNRLDTALAATRVDGVGSNLDFCRFLLAQPRVRSGELDTNLLDQLVADDGRGAGYAPPSVPAAAFAAACQAIESAQEPSRARGHAGFDAGRGWRLGGPAEYIARFEVGAAAPVVARLRADDPERLLPGALGLNRSGEVDAPAEETFEVYVLGGPTEFRVTCASVTTEFRATLQREPGGDVRAVWVSSDSGSWTLQLLPTRVPRDAIDASSDRAITSPMPGSVVAVHVSDGAEVAEGDAVLAVEAMKMEHTLRAPAAGVVSLKVAAGEQVGADAVLAVIDNEDETQK
ncbi:acetyl-CoA carboxylase biotin carboxylase subunit [Dietzia timorensis]|uniref:biotin carboxylase n=3 Tax=Dietzia timorensis TaxID=499555 RepID=A0A173LQS6_9ACTN|nr:acetyl-CoA carboxylase biotin carboxylase subunit [Dietzia timorensis]ANI93060.1 Acetyl-/propionyl-coenzyme A carboxylase alpha chai n [Dietzia timorensis]